MQERQIDIQTRDGSMNTYIFHPDGDGPFPTVVLMMDSVGLREELCDMCRRIATVGYYVLMPNLFYRGARFVDFEADRINDPAYGNRRESWWSLIQQVNHEGIISDFRAMLDHLRSDAASRSDRIGIVGYCLSGRFAFKLAAAFPDVVAASASLYGVKFITDDPDSPHLDAGKIKGEMYFGIAEHDSWVPPKIIEQLGEVLRAAKINATVELYPEVHHGFAFPDRRVYDKAAAERHWERLFSMWDRNLRGRGISHTA